MSSKRTRYINFSLIAVVLFAAIFIVKGYHSIKRVILNKKLQNTEFNFYGTHAKLAFIENVYKGGLFEPPFGDIVVINLYNQQKVRLNYDSYFDRSPTLSKKNNCIYFESKRGDLAKELHLGSPSDIYKVDLDDFKIKLARKDISFALKDSGSAVEKPKVSIYNDSLMAFTENSSKQDYLTLCNYINKKVLFRNNSDSVADYWFGNKYLLVQRKYNTYETDSSKFYYFDLVNYETVLCGHVVTGSVVGFTRTGDVIEIKKVGNERKIRRVSIKSNEKVQLFVKVQNTWKDEGDFSSIKYFLEDTTAIVEKYTVSELSNVYMFRKEGFIKLTDKPRKRMDYTVWY